MVSAPYRICPLGAHVDHQNGIVTGMTLDHSVLFVFRRNANNHVRVRSSNFDGEVAFSLDRIPLPTSRRDWGNYLRGAAAAIHARHNLSYGLDGLVDGDMPIGGLSSSAAVGIAYLLGLHLVNNLPARIHDLIDLDAHIEHEYIGVENGILDQTTILASHKGCLLQLDCSDASWTTVPAPAERLPLSIVVAYSGVNESLASTDYNRRVHECRESAARLLEMAGQPVPPRPLLRMVSEEVFDEYGESLPDHLHRRALHFFTEQRRVQDGIVAWEQGDWPRFGRLIQDSGRSSIHNYECGCPPLISLYTILNQCEGVYGARFSGAGFRGCCIGFAQPQAEPAIRKRVLDEYRKKHPELADVCRVIFCRTDDGARTVCEPSS